MLIGTTIKFVMILQTHFFIFHNALLLICSSLSLVIFKKIILTQNQIMWLIRAEMIEF
jgi:hypothetical protein